MLLQDFELIRNNIQCANQRPFTDFLEDIQFAIRKTEKILKMQANATNFITGTLNFGS